MRTMFIMLIIMIMFIIALLLIEIKCCFVHVLNALFLVLAAASAEKYIFKQELNLKAIKTGTKQT